MMMVMMETGSGRAVSTVHLAVRHIARRPGHGVRMMRVGVVRVDSSRRGGGDGGGGGMRRPHLAAVEGVLRTVRAAKWAWSTV